MIYDLLVAPFAEFTFMKRALAACIALALGGAPIGVLLVLRRMSLMGDALAHSVLPGAALGFVVGGLSLPALALGGVVAGLVVALLAGMASRATGLMEDASLAGFFLIALAAGVLIVSLAGNSVDLTHVLFGNVLAVDAMSLTLVVGIAGLTLAVLALSWRPLIAESFDPEFMAQVGGGGRWHMLFLVLVVLNLVAGFQALGTLMALGLMVLPAVAARLWARSVWQMVVAAVAIALATGYGGLLISWHAGVPSGPAIVLTAGVAYGCSLFIGSQGGVLRRRQQVPHRHG
ncbi:MAG: metal ABC transporter permease [Rhodospirillales bacterium]|nr:MAG: metal ABC transporter permease [Rhodospirillales bacterium]